ncbi:Methyltransferase domain-containing protein [Chitinophaga costaii]|uniref:Methyltransferase domain-containing protein n=1 Tax=Chitinophaga costaii TaxID=1335309 RepID=A0A1C3ZIR0_9BACT|nr:class I SAM-dependent methyltransferase [Chitinophaga costaii]PUZ30388.1 class I SAM-dependent methyltransferase [Chitinophaga costaii]SCB82183.1 Methyltransferase domain-containing protein [Chitinophaga costaii]
MEVPKQWFRDWFNSPYYYLLYANRDEKEAAAFIDKLLAYLQPKPGCFMLDVACGKGRHAQLLASRGFDVTGIDLSIESILAAKKQENDHLHFYQHDMRLPFRINYFDVAFNFFTSFGYFATARENNNALRTIAQALKPGGRVMLDYLNSTFVQAHLVPHEVTEKQHVVFDIRREVRDHQFIKEIRILDRDKPARAVFTECVNAFTLANFQQMFAQQGLKIQDVFGDYYFNAYSDQQSPRLILLAEKI